MDHGIGVGERVRRVLAGDREAAAWLYDTLAPRLYRRLLRRYPHLTRDEVEDALHDAFVLLLAPTNRTLRGFVESAADGEAELERRIWGLACGMVANRRRAGRATPEVALGEFEPTTGSPTAEQVALHRNLLAKLGECLARRRARLVLYLTLRHRDGLAPEEIMRATGWSPKATYKLKAALDEAVRECARWAGITLG